MQKNWPSVTEVNKTFQYTLASNFALCGRIKNSFYRQFSGEFAIVIITDPTTPETVAALRCEIFDTFLTRHVNGSRFLCHSV